MDSWIGQAGGALSHLSVAALDQLLESEAALAAHVRQGTLPEAAPSPSTVTKGDPTLLAGAEVARPKQLSWWVRFQTAKGAWATVARTAVALAIVGAVLGGGWAAQSSDLFVYDGLERSVVVSVGDKKEELQPQKFAKFSLDPFRDYPIQTATISGKPIESFHERLDASGARYVYNIASASPLVAWTAVYGSSETPRRKVLGAPRWIKMAADYVFEDPLRSVSMTGGLKRATC